MLTYTVGFGKASFAHSGVSLAAFAVEPPYVRKLISKAYKLAQGTRTTEYPSTSSKTNGALYAQSVDIPEGAILQIQASRTYRGAKAADGVIFVRTRYSGPMRQIMLRVPIAPGSFLGNNFVALSGRFDVLDLADLNKLGITPHSGMVNGFMNQDEVDELFYINTLAQELSPAPEIVMVEDVDGNETAVFTAPTPKRRIRIR